VRSRVLLSGRKVPELKGLIDLSLETHCPEKWVTVDLETGDVWSGCKSGWYSATVAVRGEAAACLSAQTARSENLLRK